MLANVERLTVVGDVLLDTKRQQFRDAEAASRKKRGSHWGVADAIQNMKILDAFFRSEKSGKWEKP